MVNIDPRIAENRKTTDVVFYTVADLMDMLGWGKATVLKLFADPNFPSTDFGKQQVVEAHALIEYFSVKHCKDTDRHWNGKGVRINGRKKR